MSIISREATLTADKPTTLFIARFARCRLTLTGVSGEFTTIPFQTKTRGGLITTPFFEASEIHLTFFQTFPSATIFATTPEGVATLDIVYEVRTKGDL